MSDAEGKVIRTARTLKGKVMGETGKDGADLPGRTELKDREGGGGRNFSAAVSSKQRIVQAIQNTMQGGIPRPASVLMPESAAFAAKARGKARVHVQKGQGRRR